jgi:Rap1a immunity proteins
VRAGGHGAGQSRGGERKASLIPPHQSGEIIEIDARAEARNQFGVTIDPIIPTARREAFDGPEWTSRKASPRIDAKNRTALILVAIAVASLANLPVRANGGSRDLARECRVLDRQPRGSGQVHIPNTKGSLLCWGYMEAMQDLSVLTDEDGHRIMGACPPERTTLLELIHSFVKYADSHRRELSDNAAVAVIAALQESFPCEHGNVPDKTSHKH